MTNRSNNSNKTKNKLEKQSKNSIIRSVVQPCHCFYVHDCECALCNRFYIVRTQMCAHLYYHSSPIVVKAKIIRVLANKIKSSNQSEI